MHAPNCKERTTECLNPSPTIGQLSNSENGYNNLFTVIYTSGQLFYSAAPSEKVSSVLCGQRTPRSACDPRYLSGHSLFAYRIIKEYINRQQIFR